MKVNYEVILNAAGGRNFASNHVSGGSRTTWTAIRNVAVHYVIMDADNDMRLTHVSATLFGAWNGGGLVDNLTGAEVGYFRYGGQEWMVRPLGSKRTLSVFAPDTAIFAEYQCSMSNRAWKEKESK